MKSTFEKRKKRIRRAAKTKAVHRRVASHRLVAHRSGKHIYGQIILSQPNGDVVIAACSSKDSEIVENHESINKKDKAVEVGKLLAARAIEKQIGSVAFDRSGYKYHGRIKALADGAREAGLKF